MAGAGEGWWVRVVGMVGVVRGVEVVRVVKIVRVVGVSKVLLEVLRSNAVEGESFWSSRRSDVCCTNRCPQPSVPYLSLHFTKQIHS